MDKINKPTGGFQPITHLGELKTGDIVRGKISHRTYVVTANYGTRVTAVATQDITNPSEWDVLKNEDAKRAQFWEDEHARLEEKLKERIRELEKQIK